MDYAGTMVQSHGHRYRSIHVFSTILCKRIIIIIITQLRNEACYFSYFSCKVSKYKIKTLYKTVGASLSTTRDISGADPGFLGYFV